MLDQIYSHICLMFSVYKRFRKVVKYGRQKNPYITIFNWT